MNNKYYLDKLVVVQQQNNDIDAAGEGNNGGNNVENNDLEIVDDYIYLSFYFIRHLKIQRNILKFLWYLNMKMLEEIQVE